MRMKNTHSWPKVAVLEKGLPFRCDFEQFRQVFEERWAEDSDRLRPVDGDIDRIKE